MSDGESTKLTVLEFFTVGNLLPAVLLRAVKGGWSSTTTKKIVILESSSKIFYVLIFDSSFDTIKLVMMYVPVVL